MVNNKFFILVILILVVSGVFYFYFNNSVPDNSDTINEDTSVIPKGLESPSEDRLVKSSDSDELIVKDEILIGFKDNVSKKKKIELARDVGGVFIGSDLDLGVYQLRISTTSNLSLDDIISELSSNPTVDFVRKHTIESIR